MNLSEFKAWLDGYEASFSTAPNADRWAAIKAKLATVEALPSNSPFWSQRPDFGRISADEGTRAI